MLGLFMVLPVFALKSRHYPGGDDPTLIGQTMGISPEARDQPAFLAQTMHQPLTVTCLPGKYKHGPLVSLGLPVYAWQLLHFWSAVCLAYFLLLTLVVSAT